MTPLATRDTVKDWRAVVRAAALWLLFLAPFFYLTYGVSNWLASIRPGVPDIAFSWEQHIPFIAWTIVPYWSINAFYGLSLFICDTPAEVGRLARRYLTAQIIAVLCFVLFPLQAIFVRPETTGLPGFMFDVLGGFDKPFNQAPSLHIALLVIIWDHWRSRLRGVWLVAWHGWSLLIGVSVLTTWQHHVMDIPAGALLGLFALWLFPREGASPLAGFRLTADGRSRRLALAYGFAGLVFLAVTVVTISLSGAALFWLWPALAMGIVAAGYAGAGPCVFQKGADGTTSLASHWLLMSCRWGVALNILLWTRKLAPSVEIADGVHLGRFPRKGELRQFSAVVDMAAETERPVAADVIWRAIPSLDLVVVSPRNIDEAASAIEALRKQGPVLVCCALGFQRSAAVIACWLVRSGRAASPGEAVRQIGVAGRRVHLTPATLHTVEDALR